MAASWRGTVVAYAAAGPPADPVVLPSSLTRSERKAAHALADAAGLNHISCPVQEPSTGKPRRVLRLSWPEDATEAVDIAAAAAQGLTQVERQRMGADAPPPPAPASALLPVARSVPAPSATSWAARAAAALALGLGLGRGRVDVCVAAAAALGTLLHERARGSSAPTRFDAANEPLRLLRKAEAVLAGRSTRMLVVVERSVDSHNHSAVLRTAEALGVQHVWTVQPPKTERIHANAQRKAQSASWAALEEERKAHVAFARGAARWLTTREFETSEDAIIAMRAWVGASGEIWVTELAQHSDKLVKEEVMPPKLALVFGSESSGISTAMAAAADRSVYLPLYGFADSLNLSVSAALVMHQLLLANPEQRGAMVAGERAELRAGFYAQLARSDREALAFRGHLSSPPPPFDDVRRPDVHRVPWVSKRQKQRDAAANATLAATMIGIGRTGSAADGAPPTSR